MLLSLALCQVRNFSVLSADAIFNANGNDRNIKITREFSTNVSYRFDKRF